jgi:hypothetical protein
MPEVHERKSLRDAVVAALKAASTSAGDNVFPTRVAPYKQDDLPVIAVYTLDEDSDDRQTAPREYKRTIRMVVAGVVQAGTNVDDAMDALDLEIEEAMDPDPTFGHVCADSVMRTTKTDLDERGAKPVGILAKTYDVTLYTDARMPADSTLDDLATVDARYSLGGTQATADQAEDKVEDLDAPEA